MIVRNFLQWAMTASAAQRSEGAGALARAYLYSELDERTRRDAEIAMMSLLDDPSPLVRRALADNFASAADAPHSLISALANDQSDIAAPVLSRSPLLSEAELVDCAAIGDAFAQSAIALRARVPVERRGGARRSRRARGGDFACRQSRRGTGRIFDASHDRALRRRRRNARGAAVASLAAGDDPQPVGRGGGGEPHRLRGRLRVAFAGARRTPVARGPRQGQCDYRRRARRRATGARACANSPRICASPAN